MHCDLNNFFASVECLEHPELKGVPTAVAGSVENRHGIILAKNEPAKRFGVKTAEAVWQARQKCPSLVILEPHYEKYTAFSREAREIYRRYTEFIEPFGIDECWLDVTGSLLLFGDGKTIADRIRGEIKRELGITASAGVSFNKVFAKLGSDIKKPDATTVIPHDTFREKIWRLPASDMLGVGKATGHTLSRMGLLTIGDVARADPVLLRAALGKGGEYLWYCANGMDGSPVRKDGSFPPPKSIGRSTTKPFDLESEEQVRVTLISLCESVAHSLRENHALAGTIQLGVRDTSLVTYEHQRRLLTPTRLVGRLVETGLELYSEVNSRGEPLRSIGIRACELVNENECVQLSLDCDARRLEKLEAIESSVDSLRSRFGKNCIRRASLIDLNEPDSHPVLRSMLRFF